MKRAEKLFEMFQEELPPIMRGGEGLQLLFKAFCRALTRFMDKELE